MTGVTADGQPVIPLPERDPVQLRQAVTQLDAAVLPKFEAEWATATSRARDEYSLLPQRHFVELWWTWVAVNRWPQLVARMRECERIFAESPDRAERRAAANEISLILHRATSATV